VSPSPSSIEDYALAESGDKWTSTFVLKAKPVAAVGMYVDGLGGVYGTQKIRAVIYRDQDFIAMSEEEEIVAGDEAQWIMFQFRGEIPPFDGEYQVGFHSGDVAGVARVHGQDFGGPSRRQSGGDLYSDGPSDPFGDYELVEGSFRLLVPQFEAYVPLSTTSLTYISRLPFAEAQAALKLRGTRRASRHLISLGWHGTKTDADRGSFAVVRADGPLVGLLGKRVRVSIRGRRSRIVYAYVHALGEVAEDLTLTRRLFQELGSLGETTLLAAVEEVDDV